MHTGQAFDTATASQIGSSGSPKVVSLGTLADNGGPTLTHAMQAAGSELAVDTGSNLDTGTVPSDQRGTGYNRFVNGTIDIGAFEFGATGLAAANVTPLGLPSQVFNNSTLNYAVPPGENRFLVVTVAAVAPSGSPTFTGGTFLGAFTLTEGLKRTQGTMAYAMYYLKLASNTAASAGDIVMSVTNGSITCR